MLQRHIGEHKSSTDGQLRIKGGALHKRHITTKERGIGPLRKMTDYVINIHNAVMRLDHHNSEGNSKTSAHLETIEKYLGTLWNSYARRMEQLHWENNKKNITAYTTKLW